MPPKVFPRLHRRGYRFYFRAAVPTPWRSAIKPIEIKFSLNTEDRSTAILRCRVMSNAFDMFFREATLAQIPIGRIDEAARAYFQERLNKALEFRIDLPCDPLVDVDFEIQGSRDRVVELREMLKTLNFENQIKADASEVVGEAGRGVRDADALLYACQLVARAQLLQNTFMADELTGNVYSGAQGDPVFAGMLPNRLPEWDEQREIKAGTLGQGIDRYIDQRTPVWGSKTILDQKRSLYFARDVIGAQRQMRAVDAEDIRQVKDRLMKMQRNSMKSGDPSTLVKIIKADAAPDLLSAKTREKYFAMVRGFFKWAVDEDLIAKPPGLKVSMAGNSKHDAIEDRYPYTPDQLQVIFRSPVYTGYASQLRRSTPGVEYVRDGYFWVPLVALYSGMRLGEIVQLTLGDLNVSGEVPFFDICEDVETDKVLKTAASRRQVPVHPALIALGLMQHLEQAKRANQDRLFDDIKPSIAGYYSGNFSKWWGRYCQRIGVKTKKNAFHSFRHNFTDALREADVSDEISRALVGHSSKDRNRDVHLRYGSKIGMGRLREAVAKVEYQGVLSLVNSRGFEYV